MGPCFTWIPVHEGSVAATQLMDAAGASFPTCSYYMTILFQSTHTQWHCGFTAGKRRKLLYKQGYSWLCSPVCLQGSPCMPMSPKQSGNQLHTVVLLTLSKTVLAQILCLQEICPRTTLSITFPIFPGFQPLIHFQQPTCFPQHLQLIPSDWVLVPDTL